MHVLLFPRAQDSLNTWELQECALFRGTSAQLVGDVVSGVTAVENTGACGVLGALGWLWVRWGMNI